MQLPDAVLALERAGATVQQDHLAKKRHDVERGRQQPANGGDRVQRFADGAGEVATLDARLVRHCTRELEVGDGLLKVARKGKDLLGEVALVVQCLSAIEQGLPERMPEGVGREARACACSRRGA